MCGITGIWYRDSNRKVEDRVVRAMCERITHRGPDDEGVLTDGNFGMGMRRLAIIDLGGGRQPIFSEDRKIAVVFNGEIYNHQDLRRELEQHGHLFASDSDTEVLVHGYEQWGSDLPKKLNGMFAFCIWDERRRQVMLARDHVGIKPLYLYRDGEKIVWASEIKAILAAPGVAAELNPDGLFDFMSNGYITAPRTMFKNIEKVPPATTVILRPGREAEFECFWDLEFSSENRSCQSWVEEIRELLDDSVKRRLMSDVPLGAFLSGGIDSSAIVATMSRLGVNRISTYAIGFSEEDAFHSELDKARGVAKTFGTDHHEIVVEPNVANLFHPLIEQLDEPMTDTSFVVTYLVSKLARESVKVILSGIGGDEIFGGYRRYLGPKMERIYQWMPGPMHRYLVKPLASRLPVDRGSRWKSMARYARRFVEQFDHPPNMRYQGYVGIFQNGQREAVLTDGFAEMCHRNTTHAVADYYAQAPAHNPLDRMMYADLKTALVDSLLAFTDKMSMAVSLEARVPLLDRRLIETAAKIPPGLRLHGFKGMKHILRLALQDRLSAGVLNQRKQGFGTPVSRWFRGSLKPMLLDLLSKDRLQRRGYFDADHVWRLMDDHMQQRADNSEHILALLTFEIWHQSYLD